MENNQNNGNPNDFNAASEADEFLNMPPGPKPPLSARDILIRIICIILSAALLGVFAYWLVKNVASSYYTLSIISATLCTILFGLCLIITVPRIADFFTSLQSPPFDSHLEKRSKRFSMRHPWLKIFLAIILSRLIIYIVAYAIWTFVQGYSGGLFEIMEKIWTHSTDSRSYFGIAERWYVTEGDPMYHIVFFPLFPILIKVVWFAVRDYFASALVVSNICAGVGGVLLYELAALDMPRKDALKVVKYLFILPAACFFGAPMTESLFLMLSVGCILLVRKQKYLFACIVGALAAFSRAQGALLLVPIFVEYVRDQVALWREGDKKAFQKALIGRGLCLFIVPLGLLAYVLINYTVWGDPLKFMEFQKDHWRTGFGWFFNTASYQVYYLLQNLSEGDIRTVIALWGPNLLCIFASLGVMLAAHKRIRASYFLYFLVYFAVSIGVTWLLSAPRYFIVLFPLAFALAALTKTKKADMIVTVCMTVIMLIYTGFLVLGYRVY